MDRYALVSDGETCVERKFSARTHLILADRMPVEKLAGHDAKAMNPHQ